LAADVVIGWGAGLSLRVRLLRSLPERFKVDIKVKEGTHQSENAGALRLFDKTIPLSCHTDPWPHNSQQAIE
jgi:hypothetical protein